jgi:hypothetical protein
MTTIVYSTALCSSFGVAPSIPRLPQPCRKRRSALPAVRVGLRDAASALL